MPPRPSCFAPQMLEVFMNERLQLASEGYVTDDPFEQKVGEGS